MKIKWSEIMDLERRQFEAMTENEKYAYFLAIQVGSPYGWGKENPEAADCSGSVQLALYAATGCRIRTTADGLYRNIFTVTSPGRDTIRAVFFLTRKDVKHGEGLARKGQAVHMAGLVGDGVVLNSQTPAAAFRNLDEMRHVYGQLDCAVEVRGLDRAALEEVSRQRELAYGLDPELERYFEGEPA